jgi:hypothetical protein
MANKYVATRLELTIFIEANRLDFKYDGPLLEDAERTSVFYDKVRGEHTLGEKLLLIPEQARKKNGHLVEPNHMTIVLDGETIKLPRAKSGKPRYYKPLETANEAAAPKTASELFNRMGV